VITDYYLDSNPDGFIDWTIATNGTLALASDLSNYATNVKVDSLGNWTLDKTSYSTTSQANALYYAINNPSGFYNSTDFSISNYVLTSALDYYTDADIDGSESAFTGWDKDASDDLELSTILAFNYYNSTDFSISDYLTKALWNTNYTANNDLWLADTNTQLSDGDISAFGYIKDYTETDPLWTANWTNVAFTNIEETFSGNVTLEGIKLEGDTTNHRIYDNATCIIMTGDTSELRIC